MLCAVTKKLEDLERLSVAISERTETVVAVAHQVSLSIDNEEQQDKIAEAGMTFTAKQK